MRKPYKLTPEVTAKISRALRLGAFLETAAGYAGLDRDTLKEWIKLGRGPEARQVHREFVEEIDAAMADAEVAMLQRVSDAEEWQASAWRLERRYPDRWGRIDRLKAEHTGKDGAPLAPPVINIGFSGGGPGGEVVTTMGEDDAIDGDSGAEDPDAIL